jgi:hypothetical protein
MRSHPEGGGVAEPDRGLVAYIPQAQADTCWGGLRRRIRDRSGNENRCPAPKPESQPVGVGSEAQTAAVPEANHCVPYLRNGALDHGADFTQENL